MSKIIDRTGKGSKLTSSEYDSNVSSLSGINEAITATTHTIDVADQNRTLEYSNASAIAVTLPAISTLSGANIHTEDFKVTLKNVGAGTVTATCDGLETTDAGDATIVLLTGESVTIQTNSTLEKWNVFPFGITGVTSTTAELNILDGVTRSTADINDLATKTGAETLSSKTLVAPELGTPASGVATNLTGTAAGLSIGGNAATATKGEGVTFTIDGATGVYRFLQFMSSGVLSWYTGININDDYTVVRHNDAGGYVGTSMDINRATGKATFENEVAATTFTGALNGNAATATALQTARLLGGVSFNGTANINLPGVNTAGNQDTTGKANTAGTADNIASQGNLATRNSVSAAYIDDNAVGGSELNTNIGAYTTRTVQAGEIFTPATGLYMLRQGSVNPNITYEVLFNGSWAPEEVLPTTGQAMLWMISGSTRFRNIGGTAESLYYQKLIG